MLRCIFKSTDLSLKLQVSAQSLHRRLSRLLYCLHFISAESSGRWGGLPGAGGREGDVLCDSSFWV